MYKTNPVLSKKSSRFWFRSGGKCNHLPTLKLTSWRDGYKMTSRGTTIFVHYVLMSIAKTPNSDNGSTLEKKSSDVHNYDSLLPRNMSVDRNEPKYGSFSTVLFRGNAIFLMREYYNSRMKIGISNAIFFFWARMKTIITMICQNGAWNALSEMTIWWCPRI